MSGKRRKILKKECAAFLGRTPTRDLSMACDKKGNATYLAGNEFRAYRKELRRRAGANQVSLDRVCSRVEAAVAKAAHREKLRARFV